MSIFIPLEGTPTEKQREFIESTKRFVLFGGNRGLGKSWAIRRGAIEFAMQHAGAKVLLLRRTRSEAICAIQNPIRIELHGTATPFLTQNVFRFENGSTICIRWCEREEDIHQFAGTEYDEIGIDEAQQFTEYQLSFLELCGIPRPLMRYTATLKNEDSGYSFLKRRFCDKQYLQGENADDFHMINATIYDNGYIIKNMPELVKAVEKNDDVRT